MVGLVLIVGEDDDWSADAVAAELDARGVVTRRLDTADFPQRARLAARIGPGNWTRWHGRIETADGTIGLDEVTAVYYRKPRDFDLPAGLSEPERRFARAQARVGIGGLLASLPVCWINHMAALADAEYKPAQLALGARCGLMVPPTLITNDPEEVIEFAAHHAPLVVKPLAEPIVHEGGGYTAIYTRKVTKTELADLTGIQATAHLFQQFVPKRYEVRVTVIGERLFPVAIHAGSESGRLDWRTDYNSLSYEMVHCPAQVTDGVLRYLKAAGLVYGAFDFVVRGDTNDWVMLECNASGQWGWLAEYCDLPIASAIADELTREAT